MDKVERVARALCEASGLEPDALYSTNEREVVPNPGGGHVDRPKKAPLWTRYTEEARRFIAAAEALGTITSGG